VGDEEERLMIANDNWHVHPGLDCCPGTPPYPQPFAFRPGIPAAAPRDRCPATTVYTEQYSWATIGVQCKFDRGHEGKHAGHASFTTGDVFWPQLRETEAAAPVSETSGPMVRDDG
jgi:hypothetical protein